MNFTPDMLAKVLAGEKTQTRRPWKLGESRDSEIEGDESGFRAVIIGVYSRRYDAEGVPIEDRLKWRLGKTYAVCPGRGKKAVARMKIKEIRCERAIDISEEDARAEGFNSREAFFDKLRSLYGANVDLTTPYWALTFELAQP